MNIESALRQLPYSLDVPLPPSDRELVSWFLFDQRRGYCDYFATAMVVLARLNGIPARLAVGYATGSYDNERENTSSPSWTRTPGPNYTFQVTAGSRSSPLPPGRCRSAPKPRWWGRPPDTGPRIWRRA